MPCCATTSIGIGRYTTTWTASWLRDRLDVEVSRRPDMRATADGAPADLVLLNDGDLTFAKVRFDDRSLATVRRHLSRLSDPLARALCWGALWDATRDGELPPRTFVDAVARCRRRRTTRRSRDVCSAQARTAAVRYAPPVGQPCERLARGSSGSAGRRGQRPAATCSWCGSAAVRASTDHALLEGLLAGTRSPPGWSSTPSCAGTSSATGRSLGLLDEDDVERELAADRTASGWHAEARAASPPGSSRAGERG